MPAPLHVYLDNAATSFPKPDAVNAAVDRYNREIGTAVGRGAYRQAVEVQGMVDRCRKRAADLLGAESPDRIVFTFNCTDSLSLAIHGLVNPGDHVVTSAVEHNSVLRPLRALQDRLQIDVDYIQADRSTGRVDPADFRRAMRGNTRLVVLVHASNVNGVLQPITEVGEIARKAKAVFLVDAAQSAGNTPIDLSDSPVDLLACPGHKGLLGPLGTGLLYIRPGIEERLRSIRQGGTGSDSENDRQPVVLPDKYESGNHNAPGLFGLEAGLAFLQERGVKTVCAHERELTRELMEGLQAIDTVEVLGPAEVEDRVGVVSCRIGGFEPQVLATILDESFQIQTRAGLHCAPGMHRALGTFDDGGTVRLSAGPFTTQDDIAAALHAFREIAGSV